MILVLALATTLAAHAGGPKGLPVDFRWSSNAHLLPADREVRVDGDVASVVASVYAHLKLGGGLVTGEQTLTAPGRLERSHGPGCVRAAMDRGWDGAGTFAGRKARQAAAEEAAAAQCPEEVLDLPAGAVVLTATTGPRSATYTTRDTRLAATWGGSAIVTTTTPNVVRLVSELTIAVWADPAGKVHLGAYGITRPTVPPDLGRSLDGSHEAALVRDLLLSVRQSTRAP